MATISELIIRKESLPIGNVYIKTIYGNKYYYYQYFSNGKRFTKKIDEESYLDLKTKIRLRKEIESQIDKILKSNKNIVLSRNARKLTGYIMSGNIKVAEFNEGILIWKNDELCPLIIKRTNSIEEFLKLRVMDMSRTNARILKKVLNIRIEEDYQASLYSYALSINDDYWFKPKHSKINYQNIIFNNDSLFETSLKGETTYFPHQSKLTPELTTTGSYEKGWRLIDNEWWLYKSGKNTEYFSEMFSYKFAELIGLETAIYEMDKEYIRTKNFSPNTNFEPLAAIVGDNEEYNFIFNELNELNPILAKQYLKILFFDAAINNIDRHNENLGIIRERGTGKITSLSPNFDNNLAVIATTKILKEPKDDGFISIFINFLKKNNEALNIFKTIKFKDISLSEIENIVQNINIEVEQKNDIPSKIFNRYYYLKDYFNKQHN